MHVKYGKGGSDGEPDVEAIPDVVGGFALLDFIGDLKGAHGSVRQEMFWQRVHLHVC